MSVKAARLKRGAGIGTCNRIRAFVIETPNVSFRDLFYAGLPDGLSGRAVSSGLNYARATCATIANWQPTHTLAQHRNQVTRARAACIMSFVWHRLVFGKSRQQRPSVFAGQTGGPFQDGNDGLTGDQVVRIMQTIEAL
jgi:hypothetical protein